MVKRSMKGKSKDDNKDYDARQAKLKEDKKKVSALPASPRSLGHYKKRKTYVCVNVLGDSRQTWTQREGVQAVQAAAQASVEKLPKKAATAACGFVYCLFPNIKDFRND